MTKDHRLARRHVVHTILETFTGADGVGGEAKDFAAQPTAVRVVGDDESDTGEQSNHRVLMGNQESLGSSAPQEQTATVHRCKGKTKCLVKWRGYKKIGAPVRERRLENVECLSLFLGFGLGLLLRDNSYLFVTGLLDGVKDLFLRSGLVTE